MKRFGVRRPLVALALLVALLCQATWTLAGTTGRLSGQVTDPSGVPIAGATVTVTSASQAATTQTDASGHFSFLSLAPDTYAVAINKDGYTPETTPGVSIFADQTLTLSFQLQKGLKTIAHTTSRSSGNLVKSGTTADVYSVNAATQTAVQGIGSGYNIDSAYSAIYSQPGVQSQIGVNGFGQVFYIRGSSYTQVGYEYDGVPVNRAFDNYNANSLTSLGSQETEVYTGGSPAGGSSATLAGYINQVIKTGTFPGYASVNGGVGYPGFYHKLGVEIGGATPDRLFSYYVGIQGSNQFFNYLSNNNFADVSTSNNQYGTYSSAFNATTSLLGYYNQGTYSSCPASGKQLPAGALTFQGLPSCNIYAPWSGVNNGLVFPSGIQDRENVVNLHFGVPHRHDAGKDDIQVLYDNFAYHQFFSDSIQDQGGLAFLNQGFPGWGGPGGISVGVFGLPNHYNGENGPYSDLCAYQYAFAAFGVFTAGAPGCATTGGSTLPYVDGYIFAPGTTFGQPAAGTKVIVYGAPSQPSHPQFAGVPASAEDAIWNDGTVVKLQYQKNLGSNAYVRLLGYSFYSDWLQTNLNFGNYALTGYGYGNAGYSGASGDYELNTHTRGIQLQAADQLSPQHLLTFTGNYTTATVTRWNNSWYSAPSHPTNLVDSQGNCYNVTTGALSNCWLSSTGGTYFAPTGTTPIVGQAKTAGAQYIVTVPQAYGPLNTVVPDFSSLAFQDEWRPTDRIDLNLGVRYENYQYNFSNTINPDFNFWFKQAQSAFCYDPSTGVPIVAPANSASVPGNNPPIVDPNVLYGTGLNPGLCYVANAAGKVLPLLAPSGLQARHPNGVGGNRLYTNVAPASVSHAVWSPRIGGTYSFDPDTVLRFSYGRYTQPTETALEQYSNASGRGAASFNFSHFFGQGFNTPVHDNPVQVSDNYDLSIEHHFKNTDLSVKVSPFYRWTTNQIVTVALGGNFTGGLNASTQRSSGVEVAIQKGDPTRNGISGQLSYTYTDAKIKYYAFGSGSNPLNQINTYIGAYNKLTKAGGGAPFYCGGTTGGPNLTNDPAASAAGCPAKSVPIQNPYYNQPLGGPVDPNGWYDPYYSYPPYTAPDNVVGTAFGPNAFAGFLNYKHDRFTATFTAQLQNGYSYGSPLTTVGVDPRSCAANQSATGHVAPGSSTALLPDYQTCQFSAFVPSGYLAIPNPQVGGFEGMGQYREPWLLNGALQLGYDITPKAHATVTFANILNTCFGGSSTPWSQKYGPNNVVCAYGPNGLTYVGAQPGAGFFYGSNPHSSVNGPGYPGFMDQSHVSLTGALPFQVYGQIQIKL